MDPQHLFADERFSGFCVHCGAAPATRDHVPARIFLDEPYPPNLGVVESCLACNNDASIDEEYLACFIECVVGGSTDPARIGRPNVAKVLERNPRLRERIAGCATKDQRGELVWIPEFDRARRVLIKLARGHAAYEYSLPQTEEPGSCHFKPFIAMSTKEREDFEDTNEGGIVAWPEIGSRAFVRAVMSYEGGAADGWIVIQPDRYRFYVDQPGGLRVRIVIREYLACEIYWE